jgi:hypothetical protein
VEVDGVADDGLKRSVCGIGHRAPDREAGNQRSNPSHWRVDANDGDFGG